MSTVNRRLRRTRRLVRELGGRAGAGFITLLTGQIAITAEGADVAISMARAELSTEAARSEIARIEHRGDSQRAALVHALGEAITTPIDREDLYRLSRSVDDVLDNLRDFVREADLYAPDSLAPMAEMLEAMTEGLTHLERAVGAVGDAPAQVSAHTIAARKSGNHVRALYQMRLKDLFDQGVVTMDVFKMRELLRRLDVVALRLSEATDSLNDAMLKRSL